MPCFKTVVDAFVPFRETGDSPVFTERFKLCVPAGDQLMDIGLVADIEHNFVLGQVKYTVDRQGQLHYTEIGCQVPAVLGNGTDQFTPDFSGKVL